MQFRTRVAAALVGMGVALGVGGGAEAAVLHLQGPPFAGVAAIDQIPGRQLIGDNIFTVLDANNTVEIDGPSFGIGDDLRAITGLAGQLTDGGFNLVILQDLDNDANALTPFGAFQAADLIAGRIDTSAPGFFVYFNQSLNLVRLAYSTDLSSNTADIRVFARFLNLTGPSGQQALGHLQPLFSVGPAENPAGAAPEPAAWTLMVAGFGALGAMLRRQPARRPA